MNNFDWKFYLHINKDLQDAKIISKRNAALHYKKFGKNESRIINKFQYIEKSLKNFKYYKNLNDLISNIYLINLDKDKERLNHSKKICKLFSINLEIIKGVDPDDIMYKKKYDDWVKINLPEINYSNFDYELYKNKYPDLKNCISKKQLWNHWNRYGKNEGRTVSRTTDVVFKGSWGCLNSHINILKDAIEKNYDSILILEDDFMPHIKLNNLTKKLESIMKNNWKVIYLGTSQYEWNNINFNEDYYYAKKSFGTFAYIINKNFYVELLSEYQKFYHNADHILKNLQIKYPNDFLVINPNIIISNLDLKSNTGTRLSDDLYNKFKWDKKNYIFCNEKNFNILNNFNFK